MAMAQMSQLIAMATWFYCIAIMLFIQEVSEILILRKLFHREGGQIGHWLYEGGSLIRMLVL